MKKDKKNSAADAAKGGQLTDAVLNREIFYKHDVIIKQGEAGSRAYFIDQGQVEVSIEEDGHRVVLSKLGAGEIFGEMGTIQRGPRSATVTALTECILTVISGDELEERINASKDKAVRALLSSLVVRLREANKGLAECNKELEVFQDLVTGLTDKTARRIEDAERVKFRREVLPLLEKLQDLLDSYRKKAV